MKVFLKIFIIIVTILCATSYSFAIDWNRVKYKLPEEDPDWLSQVQPGTEEYSQICMAAKTRVLERVFQEQKKKLIQLRKISEKIILNQKNNIVNFRYLQEWHESFVSSEKGWLKQLELDGNAYCYAEGSLGGNGSDRMKLFFMIKQVQWRMDDIRSRWWYKEKFVSK